MARCDEFERESPDLRLERMMTQYGDGLLRLCFMMLSDRALAEDAVQEAFLRAYQALDHFRGDSSEYTWLTSIALNCCRSLRRKAWFRRVDLGVPLENIPAPGNVSDLADDTVLTAVMHLAPRYREPMLLHYYQGMLVKEIAALLQVPESTVSARLRRARIKLKEDLKEWYFDE